MNLSEETKAAAPWQGYSARFIETAFRTEGRGSRPDPDGYGKASSPCGDTIEFFLDIRKGRIRSVSYQVDGCIHTHACAGAVAVLLDGKPIGAAWGLTAAGVADYLETLPADEIHCARMAVIALRRALADFREHRHNPWKKAYRKRNGDSR